MNFTPPTLIFVNIDYTYTLCRLFFLIMLANVPKQQEKEGHARRPVLGGGGFRMGGNFQQHPPQDQPQGHHVPRPSPVQAEPGGFLCIFNLEAFFYLIIVIFVRRGRWCLPAWCVGRVSCVWILSPVYGSLSFQGSFFLFFVFVFSLFFRFSPLFFFPIFFLFFVPFFSFVIFIYIKLFIYLLSSSVFWVSWISYVD